MFATSLCYVDLTNWKLNKVSMLYQHHQYHHHHPHLVNGRVRVDLADVGPVVLLTDIGNDQVEVARLLEILKQSCYSAVC